MAHPPRNSIETTLLKRIDPRAHQLVRRLAELESWPALPMTIITALVTMLITGIASGKLLRDDLLTGFILGVAVFILFVLVSVISGLSAAGLVRRDLNYHPLASVGLEDVPRRVLVQAYFACAIWRFRMGLASATALIPAWAAGIIATSAIGLVTASSESTIQLTAADTGGPLLFALISGLGLWGFAILSTALGVLEGLRPQSASRAWLRTALPLLAMFLFITALLSVIAPLLAGHFTLLSSGEIILLFGVAAAVLATPFALSTWLIWSPSR